MNCKKDLNIFPKQYLIDNIYVTLNLLGISIYKCIPLNHIYVCVYAYIYTHICMNLIKSKYINIICKQESYYKRKTQKSNYIKTLKQVKYCNSKFEWEILITNS